MLNKNSIIGIIVMIFNLIWTGHWIWLLYCYHFTDILWFYIYPNWIIIIHIIIGMIGFIIGIKLVQDKIAIKKAILIELLITILVFLNSVIYPLF
jgi:hypothetical protein